MRKATCSWVGILTAAGACAGCNESMAVPAAPAVPDPLACSTASVALGITSARLDSVPLPPDPPGNINDQWARIARTVPGGWGGVFLQDGVPTIYLVDPDQKLEALAALHDARALNINMGSHKDFTVLQGRWDFAQLYDWRRYFEHTFELPLASSDLDEAQNRIAYDVWDAEAADTLRSQIVQAGLPCDLVSITLQHGGLPHT